METISLGTTGLEVSRVAHGLWNISGGQDWDRVPEDEAVEAIHAAIDAGITFLDTAEAYGDGYSESVVGTALDTVDRQEIVVATKVWTDSLAPDDLRASCEASRDRLGIDTIDLYYVHYPNPDVETAATARTLADLQDDGLIDAIGVSNHGPRDLAVMCEHVPVAVNQVPYSLLWRAIESDVLDACAAHDVDVVAYSPLAMGLLTGQYASPDEVPAGRARTRHFASDRPHTQHGEPGAERETFDTIDRIRSVCDDHGVSMVDAALGWVLAQDGVASAIVGTTDPDHVRANAAVADWEFPPDLLDDLAAATADLKETLGPNPDPWQSDSRYR